MSKTALLTRACDAEAPCPAFWQRQLLAKTALLTRACDVEAPRPAFWQRTTAPLPLRRALPRRTERYSARRAIPPRTIVVIVKTATTRTSDHPPSSKWWWMGAMRKKRFPFVFLNQATWMITEITSII